jgi:hypothetical protein
VNISARSSYAATPSPYQGKVASEGAGCGCPHSSEATPVAQESVVLSTAAPASSQANIKVSVYQQDPYVAKAIPVEIPQDQLRPDFTSPRVVTQDNRPMAKPDAQGNFLLAEGSDGISQVNAHVTTNGTLMMFEGYRGKPIDWAVGKQLSVTPHKQEGRNAYYSRWAGTNYFYSHSPGLGREMKTANSADVVSHETGHALLDGLRPGYFSTHDDETGAFHEAFGDCAAMLYGLTQAVNRDLVAQQTGGDLRQINAISSLAEDFGAARVLDNNDPSDDHKAYLRQALNGFTYKPPSELPPGRGSETELGREVHSFSRLFSGAFYDCIEAVYNQARSEGLSIQEALSKAEQVNGPALLRAIEGSSPSRATFRDIALGMLAADQAQNGGKYSPGLQEAFLKRKILAPADVKADQERRAQIPALQLPADLSKANAVDFLEAHAEALGLPADLPYVPERVSRNGQGETFVSYRFTQEVPVTVEGLQDKVTDVHGGVNLVFDANGKLIDSVFTEINSDTVEREMKGIANLAERNAIIEKESLSLFKSDSVDPSLFKSVIEGNKIVRIPISGCNHG